ncbi:MAG TPA: PBP1A family penicillin-binding protein [Nitrospirae bacterium]|nr:penicillin-binding protein 1A [bacterium BMS3Abin10]GBE39872.1 penicillin-binding protein 1A [bacterium BMS3Bbin08]HDH51269.1 PBP1A family penicillin-binding protein [Nitrospirota bacterium]HDK41198.1 PBP1A family penicillin-binding protein [Nitrospirota bacterium]HDK81486.1 PBP1A family penicillin-binding protein [Nitrospirota bacterium]
MKKTIFIFFVFILIISLGAVTGGYFALVRGVPQIEEIKDYKPVKGTKVYADDDTLIKELRIEKGIHASFEQIPEHMIKAVVAVEDARFWLHKGIDYVAIIRAVYRDIRAGRIKEGGSTITQQLAKVVFLSPERTVIRKLKEATLAYRLEKNLTKEEILELYLNKIYFGHGAYGIEMAARSYFGKSVSDIDLAEAALLCGLIKAPSRYSPYNNLNRAKARQRVVLDRMLEERFITEEQHKQAYEQPLYLSSIRYGQESYNYFMEYVRKYLEEKYGIEKVYKEGLRVYTTLNRNIQDAAVRSLQQGLRNLDKRRGFRGVLGHKEIDVKKELENKEPAKKIVMKKGDLLTASVLKVSASGAIVKTRGFIGKLFRSDTKWAGKLIDPDGKVVKRYKKFKLTDILTPGDIIHVRVKKVKDQEVVFMLEQEPLVQGAVVAMEPSTGYIRAIVGGYDFSKSEFNRAVSARRQAGSAFKPIIYAAAMNYGFTPASMVVDEPISYESEVFGEWEPENYDKKFKGPTRLREALAYSRNIVTIKLLEELDILEVIKFARKVGIKGSFPYDLTLALGSLSVTPLELTSAYTVFARNGVRIEPIAVKYVIDSDGNIIENNRSTGVEAIDPQIAYLTTSMLEDVVQYGTGRRARALKRPVAGKTGTTNEYKDAWFIGFTSGLAAGVWVGFDDMRQLGNKETGSRAAAPIWVSFMQDALAAISPFGTGEGSAEKEPFHKPDGIVTAVIDPLTGLLATRDSEKMVEVFKEGTVPEEYSTQFYRDLVRNQKEEMRALR